VYVNVVCDRKRAPGDPVRNFISKIIKAPPSKIIKIVFCRQSFVIPVNIRVTDANDNAPQFLHAPYVLNISEVL